ncbi:MAG: GDP-mannose 4,6-dehydratase [Deltaproteobacteria bacterium]|nr:GDP-mannose 4,6-dehydratase [Deltaproteobacteria bacterium]
MKCVVTGAAGFIGSHLCERLLAEGHQVTGIDAFTVAYARWRKERNLKFLKTLPGFRLIEGDINQLNLGEVLGGQEVVFHLAAQAGVRTSWGENFKLYTNNNVMSTQRLLEAAKEVGISRFIFASSSSLYGDTDDLPAREDSVLRPVSPYGVTKAAGESLTYLYHRNFRLPTVALRFFTVYGPRQRPDMAFYRFIQKGFAGQEIQIYGNGEQSRDFTYVSDIVQANLAAMTVEAGGQTYNVGGGARVTVNQVLELLEKIMGVTLKVCYTEGKKGDVRHTQASMDRAEKDLNYRPQVTLEQGLAAEVQWMKELHQEEAAADKDTDMSDY